MITNKDWDFIDYGQVSCIDKQIAELQARRDALLSGVCFTGYYDVRTYLDPYGLSDEEVENYERDSNETEYHNQ